jgi:hypothetical protein
MSPESSLTLSKFGPTFEGPRPSAESSERKGDSWSGDMGLETGSVVESSESLRVRSYGRKERRRR